MHPKMVRFTLPADEKYSPLPQAEDTEGLLSGRTTMPQPKRTTTCFSVLLTILVLVTSCLTSSLFGVWIGRCYPSDDGAIRRVSKYTPIMDEVDINFHVEQFNGTFVHENIYRQGPGPEVDAAWDALGVGFRPVIVPEHLASRTGLRKDHVRINEKYGGGYPVFVEGMHQLHCLNLLRKSLFYNYDYYHGQRKSAFSDPENVQRWHVTHCLDFLRQRLMCSVDIGVFGSVWVNKTDPQPFVDFNTKHVCRDFDAVRKWAEENQQPENTPKDWILPPAESDGVEVLAVAP